MVETRNIFSQSIYNTVAICLAFPEIDNHGDIIDEKAQDMQCDACGGNVVYSWVSVDGKIWEKARNV